MTRVTKELDDVCALNLRTSEWFSITEPKKTKMPEKVKNNLMNKFGRKMTGVFSKALGLPEPNKTTSVNI